jgi:DNA-directed RNA polymerase subunit beta
MPSPTGSVDVSPLELDPKITGEGLLDYADYKSVRTDLFDKVKDAAIRAYPIQNDRYTLSLANVGYTGKDRYSLKEQKKAILEGKSLERRLVGSWEVMDNATGKMVSRSKSQAIMNVPYLTDRGTYIRKGTEYTVNKQFRLVPSIYSKKTDDGRFESQFNVKPGTGTGFRIFMEPSSSVFYMRYRGKKIPLLPVMEAMGYDKGDLKKRWGNEIYDKNAPMSRNPHAVNFIRSFANPGTQLPKARVMEKESSDYGDKIRENLLETFSRGEFDADAVESSLGKRHSNVSPLVMAAATSRILSLSRGESGNDDRDSLEFQSVHDMSDFLSDKILKDHNRVSQKVLWKLTNKNGVVDSIPTGHLDDHVKYLFNNSGVSQQIEEINPFDYYDQNQRVTRMGEGAMTSIDSIPKEARDVQDSYVNFVDPIRSPESSKIGVDMRMARNVRKGKDNKLYTQFINARTGRTEWIDARTAARANVATADEMKGDKKFSASVTHKGIKIIPKQEVDYIVPSGDDMFSEGSNTVPMKSGVKGMRLLMGSKFMAQALPLVKREAPLVRTSDGKGSENSVEKKLGTHMGAVRAEQDGQVVSVSKDSIKVKYADGEVRNHDLYDNHPFMRKTYLRNRASVKKGDKVSEGQLLAGSNFTDDKGNMALGSNLRVSYMNYDGKVFEDAIVISASAAKNLTSEHMYMESFEKDKDTQMGLKKYLATYPSKFKPDQLKALDDDGVAKVGTVLKYGDPMVLAYNEQQGSATLGRKLRSDATQTWKHKFPGVVTDTAKTKKGWNVGVRANVPMMVGDKLSNRFGGKGVISDIIPDDKMPRDAQDRPIDVILSPLGIISRTNSSQLLEAQLGKIAEKTGKPYVMDGFSEDNLVEFTKKELEKHGMQDTEDIHDPRTGKTIPGIFTGKAFFQKLQHTSEGKGKARATGGYTEEGLPAKGGKTGSKALGVMEIQALLGHGATKVLKDMKLIKGQRNDSFWRELKLGRTPAMPDTPEIYTKFKEMMRAAGINFNEGVDEDNIQAMTNSGASKLTGNRQLSNANTYSQSGFKPMKGGLFDPSMTGSDGEGKKWSYISLPEPMVNPVMEDPIKSILGMTTKEWDAAVRDGSVNEKIGNINSKQEMGAALEDIKNGARTKRPKAVKKFRFLHAMKKQGTHPKDYLMDRVPVLPPKYRPITQSHGMSMVNDANYMYKSLMESIEDYKDSEGLTEDISKDSRKLIYDNYKAATGLTDPVQAELKQKNVAGILKNILGKGSPKTGFLQRRVIGTNLDTTGLAVITPNPSLKMNQVGLPETRAWDLYEPFVVRNLVQSGMPAMQAAKAVKDKSKAAYEALQDVATQRPVLINRAPTLHKYGIMAAWPVLTKGHSLQIPPTLVAPFGADFDGDTMSYSVPVSKDAVDEAVEKMMPDSNLLSSATDAPNYVPSNEYLQGLYYASKSPSRKKTKTVFNTKQDAIKAFAQGKIKINDPIEIKEK